MEDVLFDIDRGDTCVSFEWNASIKDNTDNVDLFMGFHRELFGPIVCLLDAPQTGEWHVLVLSKWVSLSRRSLKPIGRLIDACLTREAKWFVSLDQTLTML